MNWFRKSSPKKDKMHENPDIRSTTKPQTHKTSFVWTIENFSYLPQKCGQFVESSVFCADSDNETKWSLHLYPKGVNEKDKGFIGLFLSLDEAIGEEVSAKYQLSLMCPKNHLNNKRKIKHIFDEESHSFGCPTFMPKSLLKAFGLLPNDKITIYCEINYFHNWKSNTTQKTDCKRIPKTLMDDLEVILRNGNHCDVEIVVSGHEFKAHKAILAARSPVFAAMFDNQMKESQQNRVEINDIDKEVFTKLLHFIYTDKVCNEDIDSNIGLFMAANKYNLDELKSICEEYMSSQLIVETVSEVLILADNHSAQELKQNAIEFIKNNSNKVIQTNGWKKVMDRKDLLEPLLKQILQNV